MRISRLLALLLAVAGLPRYAFGEPVSPAGLPLDGRPDAAARGTARIVGSILAYSRWPARRDPLRLCMAGPVRHADMLDGPLPGGTTVARRWLAGGSPEPGDGCDAVYIGGLALDETRRLTRAVRGKPIVTITEDDRQCRGEAMFCLAIDASTISFQMNIDAIARSPIKVDPRVLRISRGY